MCENYKNQCFLCFDMLKKLLSFEILTRILEIFKSKFKHKLKHKLKQKKE